MNAMITSCPRKFASAANSIIDYTQKQELKVKQNALLQQKIYDCFVARESKRNCLRESLPNKVIHKRNK
jgi:hypothetical protein